MHHPNGHCFLSVQLRQGNVFTPVHTPTHAPCHTCPLPCMPPAMHAPYHAPLAMHTPHHACCLPCTSPCHPCPLPCIPFHAHPCHACPLLCMLPPPQDTMRCSQGVGSTHPTGMHSCSVFFVLLHLAYNFFDILLFFLMLILKFSSHNSLGIYFLN